MTIAEKLTTIAENQHRVFDAGKAEAEHQCDLKHFTAEFYGNDKTSYTINIPFEPDVITVGGYDPTNILATDNVFLFTADLRAFGITGGFLVSHRTGTNFSQLMNTSKSVLTRYSRADNGDVTLQNLTAHDTECVFSSNIKYTIVASKYTVKTDKERITEFVNGLSSSGSGSLSINQDKVNAAFTTAEWNALIATKPNWTFAMF